MQLVMTLENANARRGMINRIALLHHNEAVAAVWGIGFNTAKITLANVKTTSFLKDDPQYGCTQLVGVGLANTRSRLRARR